MPELESDSQEVVSVVSEDANSVSKQDKEITEQAEDEPRPTRPKARNPRKSDSRFSRMRLLRRGPSTPIDEGDEDVNDFIDGLIKKVDSNLKK